MATPVNITLTDATPVTPVNRVFVTSKRLADGETYEWVNRTLGIQAGYQRLQVRLHEATGNEQYNRSTCKLILPTLETTAGSTGSGYQAAPKKAYDNFIEGVARFHVRSTLQERLDAVAMHADAMAEALIKGVFTTQDPVG